MDGNKIKIGACIMAHNMAPFIVACVKSLQWVNSIFIFDDHSIDRTIEVVQKNSGIPVKFEKASTGDLAFREGELKIRNYVLTQAFKELKTDVMVILDADEMLSSLIKQKIIEAFSNSQIDSMMFSIWHLYDERKYLHFWETEINGVKMIDPHTRVVRPNKNFIPLFGDGSHPTIEVTPSTRCLHGPYHFHLKYHHRSTLPNYSIYFLSERPQFTEIAPYLKELPFKLPEDIQMTLSAIDWENIPYYKETPHHPLQRVIFNDPNEALIHPRDKQNL